MARWGAEEREEDGEKAQAEEQARQDEGEVDAEVVDDEDARARPAPNTCQCVAARHLFLPV